ncbi:uncharacterized protein LTR77_000591 [Saxophila tyrrhenica]|uniref:Rab-GAP TBC domain-containing protein n=1 Tax=Saxophila tyrrhenica TaxID=1690608 RepID=A0AAV9PRM3_9PEZI|nr:hypothetical protein LTR77_000591 [Saxophila tyrrhenica]
MAAAETASARRSSEMAANTMVIDTTMSGTDVAGLTASPMPQTAKPVEEEEEAEEDSDSASDYSDDDEFQSPPNSRPPTTYAKNAERPAREDMTEDEKTTSKTAELDLNNGSRPGSIQLVEADAVEGAAAERPQTPALSEGVSSELETQKGSTAEPKEVPADFEDVPLEAEQTPTASRKAPPHLEDLQASLPKPDLVLKTTSAQDEVPEATSEPASERQTPTIEVTSGPYSPEGSEYSNSPAASPSTPSFSMSPRTPQEAHMSMDSMHSVALSQSSLDYDHLSSEQVEDVLATPRVRSVRHLRKPSSLEILQNTFGPPSRQETLFDYSKDDPLDTPAVGSEETDRFDFMDTTSAWLSQSNGSMSTPKRDSGSSDSDVEFDWQALDMTEEQEKEDKDLAEGAEDESTAFLLARLEQENAKFAAPAVPKHVERVRSQSRPPSMAHLKKLVSKQDGSKLRYSLGPDVLQQMPVDEPPLMTEFDFWAALVQDYPSTASRLPTLTTAKIRAGIPPPLRGVVWTSMSGARDKSLEEAFEKLKNEKSPYEGIINKDVGRSFPGVELFRDADGEGQKMLGRVLKCFSLHDKDIGYCQGLGFLVGPLLMNMGEKEAFCVLVRLMDHYALRPSFLPSLSGLHMRIFQFSTLLKQHHPALAEHLTDLGVEPAYLSQWFLSCFAVTCPLPMLFRIYDVIFAEGANETVMRVAIALFRRNEEKMMASTEFEEVMQLLLGRGIWDVYGLSADELIDDFTSLGNIITFQRLAELENEFESKDRESVGQSAGFLPDVQAAASRFLGRLWTPNHAHTPSKGAAATLSPSSAEKEPQTPSGNILSRPGFLRRSPSKTSIGTINENSSEGSAANSIASTAPTDAEIHDGEARESQADSASMRSKAESMRTVSISTNQAHVQSMHGIKEQQELHTQIEDLLMALSEMQREHAQMAAMLQKEREDRNDDHRVVRKLVGRLGRGRPKSREGKDVRRSMPPMARQLMPEAATDVADKRKTLPSRPRPEVKTLPKRLDQDVEKPKVVAETDDDFDELVHEVQGRLDSNARFSYSFETKAQLRSNLTRTREQLCAAEVQIKTLSERAEFSETSLMTFQNESESLRSEVEELRTRVNDDFKEKQKLELTIQNMEIQMRMEAKAVEKRQRTGWLSRGESSSDVPTVNKPQSHERSRTGSISSQAGSTTGLRELKLGRRDSVGSVQSIRSMKMQRQQSEGSQTPPTVAVSASPPAGDAEVVVPPTPPPVVAESATPTPTPAPITVPTHPSGPSHTPSASLSVPGSAGFAPRKSSLATQKVLANPTHEPVPDEALLLELVNAKTSEAQARAEVDELRKSLQVQKRRADETLLEIQAEVANAKLEAEAAKQEAERARLDAQAARAEIFDAEQVATPTSYPSTPAPIEEEAEEYTPAKKPEPKKADTAPVSAGGGWFWSRRTASTNKAMVDKAAE